MQPSITHIVERRRGQERGRVGHDRTRGRAGLLPYSRRRNRASVDHFRRREPQPKGKLDDFSQGLNLQNVASSNGVFIRPTRRVAVDRSLQRSPLWSIILEHCVGPEVSRSAAPCVAPVCIPCRQREGVSGRRYGIGRRIGATSDLPSPVASQRSRSIERSESSLAISTDG